VNLLSDVYITLDKAAELCQVTRAAIYKWAKTGRLNIYKKGSRSLVKIEDIERVKVENEKIRPLYPDKNE
jgi:excisionase family DNA binding protein